MPIGLVMWRPLIVNMTLFGKMGTVLKCKIIWIGCTFSVAQWGAWDDSFALHACDMKILLSK